MKEALWTEQDDILYQELRQRYGEHYGDRAPSNSRSFGRDLTNDVDDASGYWD